MLDPEPFRAALRTIRHDLPLEEKLAEVIELLRGRFEGVFAIMTAFGLERPPQGRPGGFEEWVEIVTELLESDVAPTRRPGGDHRLLRAPRRVRVGAPAPQRHLDSFDAAELATLVTHRHRRADRRLHSLPPRPNHPASH